MIRLIASAALAALLVAGPAAAQTDEELARELLDGTDDIYRGESSIATLTMNVKTARWTRSLTLKAWSKGEDKSLIRIEAPAKEAGVTTLKVGQNIWNYLPKVDRTMKVPAGMMSGSWMGSHFSNDDLVKESRMADDFTYKILERPEGEAGSWVIECEAKPDAAVVWGKILVTIRPDKLPEKLDYYDEKGVLIRTMSFEDYRELGGRTSPSRMRVVPHDKPDEYTEIVYESLEFGADVPDTTFTLQAVKK